uniref:nucleolar protein 14-like n=1 Tax=Myxine glutinosa TaxID=7769 RepID=UPI00358E8065
MVYDLKKQKEQMLQFYGLIELLLAGKQAPPLQADTPFFLEEAVCLRRLKKSDLYNLNKGEELTHYGRSLADGQGMTDFIENADDDDPDDRGLLSGSTFFQHGARCYVALNVFLNVESYDMVVRELGFEMKAQPTDRLKSAEELARQEQQRLQSLEADRLRRMRGEKATVASRRSKHESADDLHDDFQVEHHERTLLSYEDGKWNLDRLSQGDVEGGDDSSMVKQPGGNEECGDGDNDDEEGSSAESDGEEQKENEECGDGDNKGEEEEEEEGSGVESDEEEQKMGSETDGNDQLDFQSKSDEASSAEEEENVESEKVSGKNESDESEKVESIQRMKTMCEAEGELPYVFAAPARFTELRELLEQYDIEQQLTVIERMIKCNHPSLPESNKENLQNLFEFLLLYVGELTGLTPPNLPAADKFTRSLFDLAHLFPKAAARAMEGVLQKAQAKLSRKKHSPGLEQATSPSGRGFRPACAMFYRHVGAMRGRFLPALPLRDVDNHCCTPAQTGCIQHEISGESPEPCRYSTTVGMETFIGRQHTYHLTKCITATQPKLAGATLEASSKTRWFETIRQDLTEDCIQH